MSRISHGFSNDRIPICKISTIRGCSRSICVSTLSRSTVRLSFKTRLFFAATHITLQNDIAIFWRLKKCEELRSFIQEKFLNSRLPIQKKRRILKRFCSQCIFHSWMRYGVEYSRIQVNYSSESE